MGLNSLRDLVKCKYIPSAYIRN